MTADRVHQALAVGVIVAALIFVCFAPGFRIN